MRVQLKGVLHVRKKLADGEVRDYWYAWRGGPRLEGHPGAPEFIASYNVAVASRKRPSNKDFSSLPFSAYTKTQRRSVASPPKAKMITVEFLLQFAINSETAQ